ncbi:MAG: LpxI family protein [Phycisphaerales bacterium]
MPLGLIASGGLLPVLVAKGMRAAGHPVMGLGMAGQYSREFPGSCDRFEEAGLLRVTAWPRKLRRMGVTHAVMVGKVDKANLMHNRAALLRIVPDWWTISTYFKMTRSDTRTHSILSLVAERLASEGVQLIDSTLHIPDHMATLGTMTRREPTAAQRADIDFGWAILSELLSLDIGQAIAIRGRDVVAVEAIEGTDRMIERAGQLCSPRGATNWTLLKGARRGHDRRSDVPTIGPDTIRTLHKAGGGCIAVASGDVIIVDKPTTLALADQLGVAVVGMPRVE